MGSLIVRSQISDEPEIMTTSNTDKTEALVRREELTTESNAVLGVSPAQLLRRRS